MDVKWFCDNVSKNRNSGNDVTEEERYVMKGRAEV